MNEDIKEMINIYNTFDVDWMGDKIESLSDLTRHHIVKKEKNGENNINNYALLTKNSHQLIHYIEINYNKEYIFINKLLLELNKSKEPPTNDYYHNILKILKKIKKEIKNKNRKRNIK